MWLLIAAVLIPLAFFVSFGQWATAALIGFGPPEAIGVWRKRDSLPPLTFVMRRYLPRWVTFTSVYGLFGSVAAYWLGFIHPFRLGALFALLGWLTTHFDVTYSGEGE
jgi:hypothetical protein